MTLILTQNSVAHTLLENTPYCRGLILLLSLQEQYYIATMCLLIVN